LLLAAAVALVGAELASAQVSPGSANLPIGAFECAIDARKTKAPFKGMALPATRRSYDDE